MSVPATSKFFWVLLPGGEVCRGGGGFRLVASLSRGARPSPAPIIPRDPNLPRGLPLGVAAYGIWVYVIQSPAQGRSTIVGIIPPPVPQRQISPLSPRTEFLSIPSDDPHLPAPLRESAKWWRGERRGFYPSPVHSPVIPSGFIPLVCRDSISFIIVDVVVAFGITTHRTSYHQLFPSNKKIGFVSCFACYIWTNWQSLFSNKFTLEWELRFKRLHYYAGFWQEPHAIDPKIANQAQNCN